MGSVIKLVGIKDKIRAEARARDFNELVGAKLQAWARDDGVTDDTMAKRLDVNVTTVWRHYAGRTPLTCLRAAQMCQVLGRDLRELF